MAAVQRWSRVIFVTRRSRATTTTTTAQWRSGRLGALFDPFLLILVTQGRAIMAAVQGGVGNEPEAH
jgi:hypothetical protein